MVCRIKEESYLERRPYLIADFNSDNSELSFILKNIGKSPAKDVKISIEPDIIKFDGYSLNKSIFSKPINFFPPQKVVETWIERTSKYFDKNPDEYKVTLNYYDLFKNNYSEELT